MTVPVPIFDVICKQLIVTGSFRYGAGDYELAISLVERGLVKLGPLVTQRFDFKDALEAFETTRKGKDEAGKVGSHSPLLFCPCRVLRSPRRTGLFGGDRETSRILMV